MKEVVVWSYSFDGWDEIDTRDWEVFKEVGEAIKRAKEIEEELKKAPRYLFCYGPYFVKVKVVDNKGDERILRKAEIGYYYNDPALHVNVEVKEGGE